MSPAPVGPTVRRRILEALAHEGEPVWLPELAERLCIPPTSARQAMGRPRVLGWVTTTRQSVDGRAPRLLYSITDTGRHHLKTTPREG